MLALAHDRRARQNDRQHGHVVYDAHDAVEPGGAEIGVEGNAYGEVDRIRGHAVAAGKVASRFAQDDLLGIAGADAGLSHGSGIDVELDRRPPAGNGIALKTRRDVDDERIASDIHEAVDVTGGYVLGRLEIGRKESPGDAPGQLGVIFIDDGKRSVVQFLGGALGLAENGKGKRPDDQTQQDVILHEALQLLAAEPEDVAEAAHGSLSAPACAAAAARAGQKSGRMPTAKEGWSPAGRCQAIW